MDLVELKNINQTSSSRHPWELARLKVISTLIDRFAPFPGQQSVLVFDIGCGDTFVAEKLNEKYPHFKFAAIDTEFSDEQIALYQLNLDRADRNIRLFRTMEEASNSYAGKASLVLLLDVAEHIENDSLFFQQLNSAGFVDEHTVFIITVPAYQTLFCSHDVFLKHFRRYNRTSLRSVMSQTNFQIIKSGYFFSLLTLARLIQVFREKMMKPKAIQGIGDWKGSVAVSKLIYFLLLSDYFITSQFQRLKINLPGLSIYAVCKKHV